LVNALHTHSLDQIANYPSRLQNYLDLIFCSKFLLHDNVLSVPPLGKSDHNGQSFNILAEFLSKIENNNEHIICDFIDVDYRQLGSWLDSVDWCSVLSQHDSVEAMWAEFMNIIGQGRSLFVPTKCRKPAKCHQSYPAPIKKLQAKKRELWRLRHIPACQQKYITVSAQYETAVEKFHVDN
jgi:hypothetical protein